MQTKGKKGIQKYKLIKKTSNRKKCWLCYRCTVINGNSNHIWIYFAVVLKKEISETSYLLMGTSGCRVVIANLIKTHGIPINQLDEESGILKHAYTSL